MISIAFLVPMAAFVLSVIWIGFNWPQARAAPDAAVIAMPPGASVASDISRCGQDIDGHCERTLIVRGEGDIAALVDDLGEAYCAYGPMERRISAFRDWPWSLEWSGEAVVDGEMIGVTVIATRDLEGAEVLLYTWDIGPPPDAWGAPGGPVSDCPG